MTIIADSQALQSRVRGAVVTPADAQYDQVRRVWNGMIDKRPALIVRCAGAGDVIAALGFARESGLRVAIRAGGHSFPGYSMCDEGLVVDLQDMKSIRVDPQARTVRAEPGVLWGEFDREAQAFGLGVTGGMISHTGIAGLTLGGGFGWLTRKHGMVVDNLLSVDLVTADGRLLHASAAENADLFWGVRGGGGNFGVVTSFEYRLHPLGTVLGGLVAYPLPQAAEVMRRMNEFMRTAPDELVTATVILTTPDGHKAVGVFVCYSGDDLEEGERVIAPLRRLGTPAMEQIGPMPYTVVQTIFNEAAVPHRRYYTRSNILSDLTDDIAKILIDGYGSNPSPLSAFLVISQGGAANRVPAEATAYVHRDARFILTALGAWQNPADDEANVSWLKGVWSRLTPHLPNAVYVNELHDEGADRVRSAYGVAFDRLAALKRKYDPDNFFRLNQNIPPA
jgi:FAD/FMN-containing dehydrogenase